MKKNYIFILFLCMLAGTVMSAPKTGKRVHLSKERIAQLKSQQKSTLRSAQATTGEVVLFEDFRYFTDGSEARPDATDIANFDFLDDHTIDPEWWGYGVFQAGGKAYLGWADYGTEYGEESGYLESPVLDFEDINGNVTLKIKLKSENPSGDSFVVMWYDFFDETYEISDGYEFDITNTWEEYTLDFTDVAQSGIVFAFWSTEAASFLDDIEISLGEGGTTPSGGTLLNETFGNEGPTSNPRAKIDEYTDYDSGAPIRFSYTTTDYPDIRATSSLNTHVWFPAAKSTDLVIDNIPAAGYSDLKLSFDVACNTTNSNVNKIIVEVNDVAVTVPSVAIPQSNAFVNSGNIAINAANTLKLRFYYTAANNPTNYGYRLDNIKITGTPSSGINNPAVADLNFYISGNTLSADNLAGGSVVEIYNLLGAKVQTVAFNGAGIELNLAKGLYIVRSGDYSQKIIF